MKRFDYKKAMQHNNVLRLGTQFFAEEAPVAPTEQPTSDENAGHEPPKTFTQEEVNKLISDRITRETKKFESTLDEKLSEANKLAKMPAEQKAEHERKQLEIKLSQRESEITKRELKATAKDTLITKGLPTELSDILVYTDADSCNASIESVSKAFETAVEKAVNEKLKGNTPKTGTPNNGLSGVEQAFYSINPNMRK